jgi:hypothetical protein
MLKGRHERFARIAPFSNRVNGSFVRDEAFPNSVNERFCKMVDIANRICGATHKVLTSTKFVLDLTKLVLSFKS